MDRSIELWVMLLGYPAVQIHIVTFLLVLVTVRCLYYIIRHSFLRNNTLSHITAV